MLSRQMPDGAFDTGFGNGGMVDAVFGTGRAANAVALQSDGRIIVAGVVSTSAIDATGVSSSRDNFGLLRYIGDPIAGGTP
jgi:hypothetical protein